jgi:hypothetical protein
MFFSLKHSKMPQQNAYVNAGLSLLYRASAWHFPQIHLPASQDRRKQIPALQAPMSLCPYYIYPEMHNTKRRVALQCCCPWQGILFTGYDICDKRKNGGNKPPTIVSACLATFKWTGKRTMAWLKCLEQPEYPIYNTPYHSQQLFMPLSVLCIYG